MSAHTPAPWMVLHDPMHGGPLVATEDVAIADVMEMEGGMSEANARLIAAAPDLLAFAERYIGSQDPCIRGDGTCTGDNGCVACELNAEARAAVAKAVSL